LKEIEEKLKKEFKKDVKINIVEDVWSKDLMSEEAKRKLGIK
jgi:metal-sulfur cluster biosynthetic enzyme